jgi:hypothetical protein
MVLAERHQLTRQDVCKSCQIICCSEHLRDPQRSVLGLYAPGLRVTNPVHTGKLWHVPRVPPPHAPSPHGSGDHSCHVHVILMLCIISCIYGTHTASSSSHCLTSLYFFFFFFFFVITAYSLPYHDSYRRSDVTMGPWLHWQTQQTSGMG